MLWPTRSRWRRTSWGSAALAPSMPVPIARSASLHSWPVYRDAMAYFIGDIDWRDLAAQVTRTGTSLQFVWGESDRIGDRRYLQEATGLHPLVASGRRPPSPHHPGRVVRVPGRHADYDRMS